MVDASGNVTNALIDHINDCLHINVEHGLAWASAGGLVERSVVVPPLEHPDWTTYVGRHRGIGVQLVTLSALEPGELIRFRSGDHAVDVTADRNGRALVPVLRPVAHDQAPASLIRVNRNGIAGHFTVQTAIFMDQARVPAGTRNRLAASARGTAVMTTERDGHIDVHHIGRLGAPIRVTREADPAPNHGSDAAQAEASHGDACTQGFDLRGIASIVPLPGFAEAPIAFAEMTDGSVLVLDLSERGAARVAGTFAGPIGVLHTSGDWAYVEDADRVSIFRVIRGGSRQ